MGNLLQLSALALPSQLNSFIGNSQIFESSGHSGAQTVFISNNGGAYLKIAGAGTLAPLAKMHSYFHKKGLSSKVINYISADRDYLLTSPVEGEDGISPKFLAEPERLSQLFGESLRLLHQVDISDCPVTNSMRSICSIAETGNFEQSRLDDIAEYIGKTNANQAGAEFAASRHKLQNDVLLHGDYCLPNIMIHNWKFAGFIDVADGGIGDRHYDLVWGLWTLNYNTKSSKYGQYFLDAYGKHLIDPERLRICGLLCTCE